jgi:hypothetical protein
MQQSEKTATRRTNCVARREVFLLDSKHTARATRQVIILNEETVMSEVGTRKLFENDRVIVWDFVLEAGEKTTVHTHTHDYVFCVLEAGGGEELFGFGSSAVGDGNHVQGNCPFEAFDGVGPEPRGDLNIPTRGRRHRRSPKPHQGVVAWVQSAGAWPECGDPQRG